MGLGIFAINEIFNAWYINGAKIFHQYDLVVVNITRFWGFLDLTLQDVDGFLFVFLNSYYREFVTNRAAMIAVISFKIFGIVFVLIISLFREKPCTFDIYCAGYYTESLYFQFFPFIIHFIIRISITMYMTMKNYEFSRVVPKVNLRREHSLLSSPNPSNFNGQGQLEDLVNNIEMRTQSIIERSVS